MQTHKEEEMKTWMEFITQPDCKAYDGRVLINQVAYRQIQQDAIVEIRDAAKALYDAATGDASCDEWNRVYAQYEKAMESLTPQQPRRV